MKIVTLILGFLAASTGIIFAQKAEVLYFKADLTCCQAKACAALESTVKEMIEKNFTSDKVGFKEVKLTDQTNKPLIDKYNAKSQTVVIIAKKKKNEVVLDISEVVREYSRSQNKDEFEKQLIAKINETMK